MERKQRRSDGRAPTAAAPPPHRAADGSGAGCARKRAARSDSPARFGSGLAALLPGSAARTVGEQSSSSRRGEAPRLTALRPGTALVSGRAGRGGGRTAPQSWEGAQSCAAGCLVGMDSPSLSSPTCRTVPCSRSVTAIKCTLCEAEGSPRPTGPVGPMSCELCAVTWAVFYLSHRTAVCLFEEGEKTCGTS